MWAQLLRGGLGWVSCQAWPQGCAQDKVWSPQNLVPPQELPSRWCCQGCAAKITQPFHSSGSLWLTEALKTSIVTPLLVPSLGFCLAAAELSSPE